jgi:hypothetical protein
MDAFGPTLGKFGDGAEELEDEGVWELFAFGSGRLLET